MDEHVLVAFDGSSPARSALSYALEDHPGDRVTVLYVVPDPVEGDPYPPLLQASQLLQDSTIEPEDAAELVVETAKEIAADEGESVGTRIEFGFPPETIASVGAEEGIDHVLMGAPATEAGMSPSVRWVVESCPATVTLVREGE